MIPINTALNRPLPIQRGRFLPAYPGWNFPVARTSTHFGFEQPSRIVLSAWSTSVVNTEDSSRQVVVKRATHQTARISTSAGDAFTPVIPTTRESAEVHHPTLDWRIVTLGVPVHQNVRRGSNRTPKNKVRSDVSGYGCATYED